MNIIVSIKQVPDTTEMKIDPRTNTLIREGVKSIINPYDKNAIEQAIRLKEEHGGKVTVITMGPPQARNALKEAYGMGADEVILLSDKFFAGADTWATAYTLAKAILKIGNFDLLLFGMQAIDGDTAQVGPGVAEFLGLPQVAYVRKVRSFNKAKKELEVERKMEIGYEIIKVSMPCLLTVVKEINSPRNISLGRTIPAHNLEVPTLGAVDILAERAKIGLIGSPTKVVKIDVPKVEQVETREITGASDAIAAEVVGILKGQRVI